MNILKHWNPSSFEISTHNLRLSERINKTYDVSGTDNTKKCKYTYNEIGFRGESIKKHGFRIMSLGCSFTEGVGVNNDETWSYRLSKMVKNGVDMNFGVGGRSNDFISRCLLSYYNLIKPQLVLIMYTIPSRREVYTKENYVVPFTPFTPFGYLKDTDEGKKIQENLIYLQNDNDDSANWYKNHLLVSYFLKSNNTPFIWNGCFLDNDFVDENRYDGNYCQFLDKGVDDAHPGPQHNKNYANNLFNHIEKLYPDIFSREINGITTKLL